MHASAEEGLKKRLKARCRLKVANYYG